MRGSKEHSDDMKDAERFKETDERTNKREGR